MTRLAPLALCGVLLAGCTVPPPSGAPGNAPAPAPRATLSDACLAHALTLAEIQANDHDEKTQRQIDAIAGSVAIFCDDPSAYADSLFAGGYVVVQTGRLVALGL